MGRRSRRRRSPCAGPMRSRGWPTGCSKGAMRRALLIRDRGCRFPGGASTYRLHGHHVRNRAKGGETSLDNLVLLCPFHHRLVHEGGFDVHRSTTRRTASSLPMGGRSGLRGHPALRHLRSSSATTRRSGSPSTAGRPPRAGTGSRSTTTRRSWWPWRRGGLAVPVRKRAPQPQTGLGRSLVSSFWFHPNLGRRRCGFAAYCRAEGTAAQAFAPQGRPVHRSARRSVAANHDCAIE